MKVYFDNLKIELESQQEVEDFYNIIAFALDLQEERNKKFESCMTKSELDLAVRLKIITEKSFNR